MKILNLTQHIATPEQQAQGVFEPVDQDKLEIQRLLTFDEIPTSEDIRRKASMLADIAYGYGADAVMVGGAPYLMPALVLEIPRAVFAFSKRVSEEQLQPDGSVRKLNVFKHVGFVPS